MGAATAHRAQDRDSVAADVVAFTIGNAPVFIPRNVYDAWGQPAQLRITPEPSDPPGTSWVVTESVRTPGVPPFHVLLPLLLTVVVAAVVLMFALGADS